MGYHAPVVFPTDETTYAPTGCGAISTDTRMFIATDRGSTGAAIDAQPNPAFSQSYWDRASLIHNGRTVVIRTPLSALTAFVKPGMPAIQCTSLELEVQPSDPDLLLVKASGAPDGYIKVLDMTLLLKTVSPRADVAAELLESAAEKKNSIYQWLAAETSLQNVTSQAITFNGSIAGNPQWLVASFLPSHFLTDGQLYPFFCSIPPNGIISNPPVSSARVNVGGVSFPSISYGSLGGILDLSRMYNAYLDMANQVSTTGGGAFLSYEQYLTNCFLLCFDLRNRPASAPLGASPGQSYTLEIILRQQPSAPWTLYSTTFGINSVQMSFSATSGVTLIPM